RAIDINGNRIKIKSTDPFLSRVLQHEVDHTNGICFVDHIAHDQDAFSVLTKSGDLVACPYSKVINSGIIADDEDNRALR
ncbi:peptide deformylase, partial [Candidatus Saccharibacteria bacterium]|nr:peptide deformylase [Candidatus Saccharibacteria bacterium]